MTALSGNQMFCLALGLLATVALVALAVLAVRAEAVAARKNASLPPPDELDADAAYRSNVGVFPEIDRGGR